MSALRQPRSAWTDAPSRAPRQGSTKRQGVAVHWPGLPVLELPTHDRCLRLVRTLERNAINDPRGWWEALPYNQVVCPHGYLIDGSGVDRMSVANGSPKVNYGWGSVCVLINQSTHSLPLPVMQAIRMALHTQAPGGRLVTHNDVRPTPTSCPGPLLTAWVNAGAKLPLDISPRTIKVKVYPGHTLWAIAQRYLGDGSRWPEIAQDNHLAHPDLLQPGQWLTVTVPR